jgi:hypothetical protein
MPMLVAGALMERKSKVSGHRRHERNQHAIGLAAVLVLFGAALLIC